MFSNPGLQDLTSFAALATNNQTNKDMQHILPPNNLSASFSTTDSITEHLLSDDCRVRTFCVRVCESYLSFFKPFSSSALLPSCRSDPSFQVFQVIFYLRKAEPGQRLLEMETKFKANLRMDLLMTEGSSPDCWSRRSSTKPEQVPLAMFRF